MTEQARQTPLKGKSQWEEEQAQISIQTKFFKAFSNSSRGHLVSVTTNSLELSWAAREMASKFILLETGFHFLSLQGPVDFLKWAEDEEATQFKSYSEECTREVCVTDQMLVSGSSNSIKLRGDCQKAIRKTRCQFSNLSTFVTAFVKCFSMSFSLGWFLVLSILHLDKVLISGWSQLQFTQV
jgi:hypothetical protein